jgi:hypothetical protein
MQELDSDFFPHPHAVSSQQLPLSSCFSVFPESFPKPTKTGFIVTHGSSVFIEKWQHSLNNSCCPVSVARTGPTAHTAGAYLLSSI